MTRAKDLLSPPLQGLHTGSSSIHLLPLRILWPSSVSILRDPAQMPIHLQETCAPRTEYFQFLQDLQGTWESSHLQDTPYVPTSAYASCASDTCPNHIERHVPGTTRDH